MPCSCADSPLANGIGASPAQWATSRRLRNVRQNTSRASTQALVGPMLTSLDQFHSLLPRRVGRLGLGQALRALGFERTHLLQYQAQPFALTPNLGPQLR